MKKLVTVPCTGGFHTGAFHGSRRATAGALGAAGTRWWKGFVEGWAKSECWPVAALAPTEDPAVVGRWLGVGDMCRENCGGTMAGASEAKRRCVGVQSMPPSVIRSSSSSPKTLLRAGVVQSVYPDTVETSVRVGEGGSAELESSWKLDVKPCAIVSKVEVCGCAGLYEDPGGLEGACGRYSSSGRRGALGG